MTPDMIISVVEETLSDSSKVYAVRMRYANEGPVMDIPAVSFQGAVNLQESLKATLDIHSCLVVVTR